MNKYHARKTVVNGIKFDSIAESDYYIYLLAQQRAGQIKSFSLQPKFLLQEGFRKNGQYFRPITYIADFQVTYPDEHIEIIDVKGMITKEFAIKRKMFEHKFSDLKLTLVDGKGNVI